MLRSKWLILLAGSIAACGCIAGSPGGAAAGSRKVSLAPCLNGMLDDAEDNNNQIIKQGERNGYWFTFADTFGTTVTPQGEFKMTPGGGPGSKYAAHIHGKTAKSGESLYVGAGFALANPKTPFDLSQARGISFWAKGPGKIRFKTPDINTAPEGDRCKDCYNDFGVDLYIPAEWTRFTVPFDQMSQQPGWGDRAPEVSKNGLFAIQWQFSTPNTEYDFWFDNIELAGCGP
jgi:endoglucanase